MTQSKHNLVTQPLDTIPSNIPNVLLFYRQKQGKKLEVRLEVIGDFSESLQVELINQRGDLLVTPAMVNSPNWTGELSLEDIQEGSYLLRVIYQNDVLNKDLGETTFELLNETSLGETDEFYQGLGIQDQITEALEKGNYTEAMSLQEKAAQCYQHNPELVDRSWEELAEKLYEKQQFLLSKEALNKALEIYSNIQELENKEEILTGIKNQLEIVNEELGKTPGYKKPIDLLKLAKANSVNSGGHLPTNPKTNNN